MMFIFYTDEEPDTPKTLTLEMVRERLSDEEVMVFMGLSMMLKNAFEDGDGEYMAIARKRIDELEKKLGNYDYILCSAASW